MTAGATRGPGRGGRPAAGGRAPSRPRVEEIRAFRKLTDEIDQVQSARLVLAGTAPASLTSDSLLVASGYPSHGWSFRDGLWVR